MDAQKNLLPWLSAPWILLRLIFGVSLGILLTTHWVGSAHQGPYGPAILIIGLQAVVPPPRNPWWEFASRTATVLSTFWLLYYTAKW